MKTALLHMLWEPLLASAVKFPLPSKCTRWPVLSISGSHHLLHPQPQCQTDKHVKAQLWTIFQEYGEIKNWRHLVSLITSARSGEPITSTSQFLKVIAPCVPSKIEKKYLAMVFQALRIEVNNEIGVLTDFLESTTDLLKPGGRLVVLSYHSLEDRIVKNFMRSGRIDGVQENDFFGNRSSPFQLINRKVITPNEREIALNPRARSGKLRIAEKR